MPNHILSTRRAFIAGAGAALLPAAAARAQPADVLARARAAGKLVVGNGAAFPPFEFVADGRLTGFDIDLGDELGRRMGLAIEWRVVEFAGLIAALTSGRVDALITAMTWTQERADRIAFSDAYYKTGIAAAYRPALDVRRPENLAGRVVGVQTGSSGEKYVRDGFADKVREIKTYNEFPAALRDLEIGRTEVVVNTQPVLRYNLSRSNRSGLQVSDVWDARDVGINTRRGETALMEEVNATLAAMRSDGLMQKLDQTWFGAT